MTQMGRGERTAARTGAAQTATGGRGIRIGEAAAACAVSPDALRYYERLGLLPKAARTSGGFRVYGPEIRARVEFIRQAQTLGLTLREIRDIVGADGRGGLARCRRVRDLLTKHLVDLDARLAALRALRRTLLASLARCDEVLRAEAAGECPVVDALRVGSKGAQPGPAPVAFTPAREARRKADRRRVGLVEGPGGSRRSST